MVVQIHAFSMKLSNSFMVSDRGICNKYADWPIIFLVSDINHLKIGDFSTSFSSSENVPFLVHPLNISFRIRAQISALTLSIVMLIPSLFS